MPSDRPDSYTSIFFRFLKFGALAWGGPAAQIAMIKRECVDEDAAGSPRTTLQEDARRLPDPSRPRGARALRLLRPPARRQARRLPRRPRLHAARLRPHARPLDPLRRGEPGRPPRRALLRADARRSARSSPGPWSGSAATFITDVPLALIAVVGLRPDALRSTPASSSSCSAPASPTSCGRTRDRWTPPRQLASPLGPRRCSSSSPARSRSR